MHAELEDSWLVHHTSASTFAVDASTMQVIQAMKVGDRTGQVVTELDKW
jgi:hypothetical protein